MPTYGNYSQWNANGMPMECQWNANGMPMECQWNANEMPCMSLRFWAQRHESLIANFLTGGYGTGCGSIMFNHDNHVF